MESAPPIHLVTPRILFYAVDGLGLGHVTRLLAIARAVRARCEGAQILFLTTSEADWVIYREGFAAIKVPSRTILPKARIRGTVYTKLVQSVVMNAVAAFNPAILVADTFPAGATQELLPTLSWEMRRVFVFRAQRPERVADPFFQSALARYDLCIAPHDLPDPAASIDSLPASEGAGRMSHAASGRVADTNDGPGNRTLPSRFGEGREVTSGERKAGVGMPASEGHAGEGSGGIVVPEGVPVIWTGPIMIRSRGDALGRGEARRRLGLPDDARIVYITFGGGGESEMESATRTAIAAAARAGWMAAVSDAPLLSQPMDLNSPSASEGAGGRISLPVSGGAAGRTSPTPEAFSADCSPAIGPGQAIVRHYPMAEMLGAFDAAISAAGYNSVAELLHFGLPSILIPFERGLDDQQARVDDAVGGGCALTAALDEESIALALERLADPVTAAKISTAARSAISKNGADTAAEAILALL